MDWWNDIWIMLSQNWTTWFGTWKWETFWSTAGVAANVYLAYVAVKTLRTSQIQAISSEKQTKEILDSAERDRQKDRNLLRPAIFVSLRPFGDTKFHIMIINCPVYPIVFTDMEINSSNYFE